MAAIGFLINEIVQQMLQRPQQPPQIDQNAIKAIEKEKNEFERHQREERKKLDEEKERERAKLADERREYDRIQQVQKTRSDEQEQRYRALMQEEEAMRKRDEEAMKGAEKKMADLKLQEAEIRAQLEDRYKGKDLETIIWYRQQAAEKLGLDFINEYNIAITGQSGTGKSTLINGFCDLVGGSKAAVGVSECTAVVTKYPHSNIKCLNIWDCPGCGTQDHPLATYFQQKYLYVFDMLVFVCTNRIYESDIDLMKQAISYKVPFILLRNMANCNLRAKRKEDPEFKKLPLQQSIPLLIDELNINSIMKLQNPPPGLDGVPVTSGLPAVNVPPCFVINPWAFTENEDDPIDGAKFQEKKFIDYVLEKIQNRRNS